MIALLLFVTTTFAQDEPAAAAPAEERAHDIEPRTLNLRILFFQECFGFEKVENFLLKNKPFALFVTSIIKFSNIQI